MFNYFKQHKVASCLILVNIVAIAIVIAVIVVHQSKIATIDIKVAPAEARIELNGSVYDNFESYDMAPGKYHVKISMDGMRTREFDFDLEKDGFQRVWAYLVDENGSFDYYLSHPDDISILEQVANDEKAEAFLEKYHAIDSISEKLPLEYYDRSDPVNPIGIYIDRDEEFCGIKYNCLAVFGDLRFRDIAYDVIMDAGFNPDDYEIIFVSELENGQ